MAIFAIDPGNKESAYCVYYPVTHTLGKFGKLPNEELRVRLLDYTNCNDYDFRIEMIASYGMAVGKDVFETCLWIGRFFEVISRNCGDPELIYRKQVKMHLCGTTKAKDANIRQAIIDLFPGSGGGKTPQIGTKAKPGPLYGVSADVWAALGVALVVQQ